MKHIATCGHEIDQGISTSVNEYQVDYDGTKLITYGTYCSKCVMLYYESGTLENEDLKELIQSIESKIKELEAQNEKLRNACVMYLDAQDWLAKVSCDKELMKTLKEIKGE